MMANLSEDIQCAGSDTRPPMLDRSDFESWQQRIRLYCLGKDNGENILKSIDEGPFKMGKFRETLAKGAEGALHLGPERDRVFADLTPEEKERFKAHIRATNILLQGLPKDIYTLINHYNDAKYIWDNVKMLLEGSEFIKLINDMRNIKMTIPKMQLNSKFMNNMLPEWGRFMTAVKLNIGLKTSNYDQLVGNTNPGQAKQIKCYNCNGVGHIARQCTHPKRPQNLKYFKDKMLLMQARENGMVLNEEHLLFIAGGQTNTFNDDINEAPVQDLALNEDNVFQADQCDAFDSDVDEAPTAQTMFMANLSSVDPIYDKSGPSYDLDILSKDNAVQVVQSNVSSVPNDALMMIINDMHEQSTQCVSANEQNKVVNEPLTAELASYKEQVELYEKRARFELTEREQKIDEQMRIIIRDRNVQEELLKKELHSVKMQLNSTINHNKLIKEEVTTLKKDLNRKKISTLKNFLT
ncbi:retrovirus-related pol polyprotein from transposon TNT 1-94 [Tanacetum coccineum]|uniref:Retrovirus-related pol polyprotein from transposon TNT 1-94 n=1 Tax=Tanacetum coccineum TaxID=301880 RepID=A0ABQ4ZC08_9ASTR